MPSLISALNWYHKKIGAYDKELWEKSVDRRILQGVCAIPRKTARIKTELIDVDLVRGSAFAKAKPQHSWVAATVSGIKRIFFLPYFYKWWKQQTCHLVSLSLVGLYFLQVFALCIYFSADDASFSEVPVSEVLTPVAMAFILGMVHSQIVDTFINKKIRKQIGREKRRKPKLKQEKRFPNYLDSESSPNSAHEENDGHAFTQKSCKNYVTDWLTTSNFNQCGCVQLPKTVMQQISTEDNTKIKDSNESGVEETEYLPPPLDYKNTATSETTAPLPAHINPNKNTLHLKTATDKLVIEDSPDSNYFTQPNPPNISSDEEYFIARNPLSKHKSKCRNNVLLTARRRHSDTPAYATSPLKPAFLSLQDHKKPANSVNEGTVRRRRCGAVECEEEEFKRPRAEKMMFSSSCESGINTPSKPPTSDIEWTAMTNTDCDSSEESESEMSPTENPFAYEIQNPAKNIFNAESTGIGKVSCTIWQRHECKKADLSALDISSSIIQKVDSFQHSSEYLYTGVFFAILAAFLPTLYRLRSCEIGDAATDAVIAVAAKLTPIGGMEKVLTEGVVGGMTGPEWKEKVVVMIVLLERLSLSMAYFFLLCVAEKAFKQRFLYAKHFCYLTSSRRAKRSDLPHFRLNKVRNIKIWLSIRSYMKKLGPQRSVDVIVSIAFILEICVVSFLCVQLLKESGQFGDKQYCWELLFWTIVLGVFLLRFMILGTKINKKYRNLSVLITEQINLYLHMEQKPHKKEELILANNVIKLASELIKELESPFKISGLSANSYLYNITKVVVLSAFSAVLTDILGFKLKLYKIKIQ